MFRPCGRFRPYPTCLENMKHSQPKGVLRMGMQKPQLSAEVLYLSVSWPLSHTRGLQSGYRSLILGVIQSASAFCWCCFCHDCTFLFSWVYLLMQGYPNSLGALLFLPQYSSSRYKHSWVIVSCCRMQGSGCRTWVFGLGCCYCFAETAISTTESISAYAAINEDFFDGVSGRYNITFFVVISVSCWMFP